MSESRSTAYLSRRAVLAMLTGALASPLARSEVYHEPHLSHDEAILIYSTEFPSLKELIFWRVDARGSFMARDFGLAPLVVKAGWYFLRSYTTMYIDLAVDIFPEPKGREDAIELISGAVNYIGDVIGTLNPDRAPAFKVKIEFRRETLVKARDLSPWLEKYPLFLSMQGRESTSMSWLDVRQP